MNLKCKHVQFFCTNKLVTLHGFKEKQDLRQAVNKYECSAYPPRMKSTNVYSDSTLKESNVTFRERRKILLSH